MNELRQLTRSVPVRLSDVAFEQIAASIVSGELSPDEHLKVDELAARLGVSRMPVREALLRLEQVGMIEMAASRYTRVTPLSEEAVRDAFEYAGNQAGWAARLATARMGDDELRSCLELLSSIIEGGAVVSEQRALQDTFYLSLVRYARSPQLQLATRDLNVVLARAVRNVPFIPDEAHARLKESFGRLREAMAGRDADGAERIVREIHLVYVS